MWRSDISQNVSKLSIDSNRLCAIRLNLNGHCLIIVCLYLPTDTHGNAFNQQSIEMILGEIRTLKLTYPYDDFIVAGDFNVDLDRKTPMVEFVNNSMTNVLSLDSLWKYYSVDFTFESMITENTRSTIDHFYVPQSFVLTCTDAGVLHHTHNTSDHSVIYVKFKCMVHNRSMNNVNMKSRPAWYKASYQNKTDYCNELSRRLDSIEVPVNTTTCTNSMCNVHDEHIDRYCLTF